MSTSAMVPMFAPDGSLGDIPAERMLEARNAGAIPAVKMQAPDGSIGYIPAPRTQEAVKAGAKLLPIEQQDTQHPGFWHSLFSDMSGMVRPSGVSPYPGMDQETKANLAAEAGQENQAQKAAGYPAPYRAITPLARSVGVNVPGMEESAAQGDVAGVMGHATAAAAPIVATEVAHQSARPLLDKLPSTERAGEAFQEVSKAAGKHTVPVTDGLSDALAQYQQLVDAGGSRSLAVSKLLNRLTDPSKGPLTYDEARLFQSNISRLSADESQRLTPVMKRQVGEIAAELNGAVENTAQNAGKLGQFRGAMKEYAAAKTNEARVEALQKFGIRALKAAGYGGATAAGGVAMYDILHQ